MKREEMGQFSRLLAEKGYDGYLLGRLISSKIGERSAPKEINLPEEKTLKQITTGEIIDAIETLEDAQGALHVLSGDLKRVYYEKALLHQALDKSASSQNPNSS